MRQRSWSSAAAEAAARRVEEEITLNNDAGLLQRIGTNTIISADEDDVARTGLKAIVMLQGKPFFFLIFTWILFILYILHVSGQRCVASYTNYITADRFPAIFWTIHLKHDRTHNTNRRSQIKTKPHPEQEPTCESAPRGASLQR